MYNRPAQKQIKQYKDKVFVRKDSLTKEEIQRGIFNRYIIGEITLNELHHILGFTKLKELKQDSELTL